MKTHSASYHAQQTSSHLSESPTGVCNLRTIQHDHAPHTFDSRNYSFQYMKLIIRCPRPCVHFQTFKHETCTYPTYSFTREANRTFQRADFFFIESHSLLEFHKRGKSSRIMSKVWNFISTSWRTHYSSEQIAGQTLDVARRGRKPSVFVLSRNHNYVPTYEGEKKGIAVFFIPLCKLLSIYIAT